MAFKRLTPGGTGEAVHAGFNATIDGTANCSPLSEQTGLKVPNNNFDVGAATKAGSTG